MKRILIFAGLIIGIVLSFPLLYIGGHYMDALLLWIFFIPHEAKWNSPQQFPATVILIGALGLISVVGERLWSLAGRLSKKGKK